MGHNSHWKLAALAVFCLQLCLATTATFTVSGQKFYLDGSEYYVKGMQYDPTPLGIFNMSSSGYGGGGLCSAKLTPYGEWKSACYDADFYDGSGSSPGRVPAGPSSWFSSLWARDLEIIASLGVNTIKLGSLNPITEAAASSLWKSGATGVKNAYGKNHIPFFDKCSTLGIKVIAPLYPNDADSFVSDTSAETKVQYLIDEIGNHSALMAWYVGSDWGFDADGGSSLITAFNNIVDYVHSKSNVPISTCVSGLPSTATLLVSNLKWDFVCANAGWDGASELMNFLAIKSTSGWASQASDRNLPILLGEVGWANMNKTFLKDHPHAFGDMLVNILDTDKYGVVGGVYQTYMDQPYNPSSWKDSLGIVTPSVAVSGLNNSTQSDIFWADEISPKDNIYTEVSSGTSSGGQDVNFKANLYSVMGRDPSTMTPTLKSTPSSAHSPLSSTLSIIASIAVAFAFGVYNL